MTEQVIMYVLECLAGIFAAIGFLFVAAVLITLVTKYPENEEEDEFD